MIATKPPLPAIASRREVRKFSRVVRYVSVLLALVCAAGSAACGGSSDDPRPGRSGSTDQVEYGATMPIEEILTRLEREGTHETYPPASEAELEQTEQVISVSLPPSYRAFVSRFSNGAYLFELQEVSAVGDGNPQVGPIGTFPEGADAIESQAGRLPAKTLVPFSFDSNGNYWCFLTSLAAADGEYPVAYFDAEGSRLVAQLAGFEEWLTILTNEQDEVIRVLGGGRYVDELNLG